MGDGAKGYNGWANYETWCVHLWLTNEEGSYRYWREEAERVRKEARTHANVRSGFLSVDEAARYLLGEAIKESFETFHPFRGEHLETPRESDVFADLLDAALSEVRWSHVAEAFLEEFEPDDEPDDEDEAEEENDDQAGEPNEADEEAYTAEEFETLKRERIENAWCPHFELGQTVSTPGALSALTREDIERALTRHHRCDWGEVGRFDWRRNEEALTEGERLVSVYHGADGTKFYVVTEADRSVTTVLLPEEY
jgi:hypothetical protein